MKIIPLEKRFVGGDLANQFNDVCLDEWQKSYNKVNLVSELVEGLVDAYRTQDGHVELKNAALKLARLADQSGQNNGYHNPLHTAHVVMMTAYFCYQSGLYEENYLTALCAAIGHDLFHPGLGNPADDCFKNERASADATARIMHQCGVDARIVFDVETMIHSTSPNGPHEFVKGAVIDPVIESQRRLLRDRKLMQMTQILLDSDIFLGAGAGINGADFASEKLNIEARRAGQNIDFLTPQARMFFLENIVGKDGFCAKIVRDLANDNFKDLYAKTRRALTVKL